MQGCLEVMVAMLTGHVLLFFSTNNTLSLVIIIIIYH